MLLGNNYFAGRKHEQHFVRQKYRTAKSSSSHVASSFSASSICCSTSTSKISFKSERSAGWRAGIQSAGSSCSSGGAGLGGSFSSSGGCVSAFSRCQGACEEWLMIAGAAGLGPETAAFTCRWWDYTAYAAAEPSVMRQMSDQRSPAATSGR